MEAVARIIRSGLSVTLLTLFAFPAEAAPIDNMNDFFVELRSCVAANSPAELSDSQISVHFGVTNKGALIGTPRVSYVKFSGAPAAKNKFISGMISVVKGCFPIQITHDLGSNIAGQIWNFELSADPNQNRQEAVH